jgi:hypothetical protein
VTCNNIDNVTHLPANPQWKWYAYVKVTCARVFLCLVCTRSETIPPNTDKCAIYFGAYNCGSGTGLTVISHSPYYATSGSTWEVFG